MIKTITKIMIKASLVIMMPGCAQHLITSPHSVTKYDQVGETCVYSEEHGQHVLDLTMSGAEQLFYVRLNKNEVHFANTRCEKVIPGRESYSYTTRPADDNSPSVGQDLTNANLSLENESLTLNNYYQATSLGL